jgi:carboxyl-terminal processing protease
MNNLSNLRSVTNGININIKMLKNWIFPITLVFSAVFLVKAYCPPTANEQDREVVLLQTLLGNLEAMHYDPPALDDDFSSKVFDLYMEDVDGRKLFLIQKEYDQLRTFKTLLDDQAKQGKFDMFNQSIVLVEQGINRAETYLKFALEKPFDFQKAESIILDDEKRSFAKSELDLKNYWISLMKYETMVEYDKKLETQEKNSTKADFVKKSNSEIEVDARKSIEKKYNEWFKRLKGLQRKDRIAAYFDAFSNVFDPHTEYFQPIEKENFDIGMSGRLEGIGATLGVDDEYTVVRDIVPGSPSWKQGELKPNDIILKVAQGDLEPVDLFGLQLNDVVKMVRGKKGTEVRLTIKKVDGTIKTISIIRDQVNIDEGYAKSLIIKDSSGQEQYGYIKLPRFYADFENAKGRFCSKDVAQELEKLKNEGVKGIILDLRNNGGGSLSDVVKMSGFFIEKGPIVQVRSRGDQVEVLEDYDSRVQYDGPLVVLVNEFSASASEILASAMQDYNRAVIIGSKSTFGKGTVQRFIDLDRAINGRDDIKPLGQVKLTTQKFYRINGGSTQLKGVVSDIILPDNYDQIEVGEKESKYAMQWNKIEAADYGQNVFRIDIEKVKSNSNTRTKEDEHFKLIRNYADRLKVQRDRVSYSLKLDDYKKEQTENKEANKKYDEIFHPIEDMILSNTSLDMSYIKEDSSRIARNDDWIKNTKKDVYVYEAMRVLKDIKK